MKRIFSILSSLGLAFLILTSFLIPTRVSAKSLNPYQTLQNTNSDQSSIIYQGVNTKKDNLGFQFIESISNEDIDPPIIAESAKPILKQDTTLQSAVTDPNFNLMRNKETDKGAAASLVFGLLAVATLVPLATWWYFSR